MPESNTTQPTEVREHKYRLIPHRGVGKTWTITATEQQAVVFAKELSGICSCRVMIVRLDDKFTPHHVDTVGNDPPKVKPNPNPQPTGEFHMGITKMSPEPRVKNGDPGPVKTELSESTVLTPEQREALAEARAAAGKKTPTKKATAKKEPKAEKPASTRLRSNHPGDPEGSRRCTHPEHEGERFFKDGKEAGFYVKPDGKFGGAWCGACKKRVSKQTREAKQAAQLAVAVAVESTK